MKKTIKLFALAALLILGGQTMAQTNGSMFLGASFPLTDYADFDGFDEFALTSTDNDGGASVGFNMGLKWYFNVGVKGLNVMLSADGFYNGANADLKSAYRRGDHVVSTTPNVIDEIIESFTEQDFSYKTTPKYVNVPVMLGLNYIYHFNPNLGVYVEAGCGGNLSIITQMETVESWKTVITNREVKTTTTQAFDKTFSFAYQAGIGIEVAKNLVIGCSFYDLGNAKVKGDQTIKKIENNATTEYKPEFKEYGKLHPMMILGRIGFKF